MALTLGAQLKAARALAGMEQLDLASASGVAVNTIRRLEAFGPEPMQANADTIRRLALALDAEGVECTNHGSPGVRKRPLLIWSARPAEVFANPVGDRGIMVCLRERHGDPLTCISARAARIIADKAEQEGNETLAKQLRKSAAEVEKSRK